MNKEILAGRIILLPTGNRIEAIDITSIIRIEGNNSYSKLYFTNGKTLVVSKVLRWFENILPVQVFFRVHKAHLVNRFFIHQYIQGAGGQIKLHNGDLVNVAKRRKACFLQSWYKAA